MPSLRRTIHTTTNKIGYVVVLFNYRNAIGTLLRDQRSKDGDGLMFSSKSRGTIFGTKARAARNAEKFKKANKKRAFHFRIFIFPVGLEETDRARV